MPRVLITTKVRWFVLFVVLFAANLTYAGESQRVFNANDESVKKATSVPPEVIELLRGDAHVLAVLDALGDKDKNLEDSWLMASEVDLGCFKALVVIGKGPLSGAHATTFWLFRKVANGQFIKLLAATADDLEVHPVAKRSCRDVVVNSFAGPQLTTVRFRFDGKKFVQKSVVTRKLD